MFKIGDRVIRKPGEHVGYWSRHCPEHLIQSIFTITKFEDEHSFIVNNSTQNILVFDENMELAKNHKFYEHLERMKRV
jgi:hypothetical protein